MQFSIFESIMMISGVAIFVTLIFGIYLACSINSKSKNMMQNMSHQNTVLIKIQSLLKAKNTTNTIAENAEMLYQDMLQHIIPIMAALDIMPRDSAEHALWRALGGIMDEYGKNPFVLEQLRRKIKLDSVVARSVSAYKSRAEKLLSQLSNADSENILVAAFADGLLGQALTLFAQAQQLADDDSNQ